MIIKSKSGLSADFCQNIRSEIECGNCSASTLLLWRKEGLIEAPRGASKVTVQNDESDSEIEIYFLVRCSFFKFNVSDPEDIIHCEGFKKNNENA